MWTATAMRRRCLRFPDKRHERRGPHLGGRGQLPDLLQLLVARECERSVAEQANNQQNKQGGTWFFAVHRISFLKGILSIVQKDHHMSNLS